MPFQVGQRVGDYEVVQLLGAGGMGHVYRVRNIISNRTEAMKVLLPDLTAEPDLATRFISEIRTLASFDHPNIAQLHTALQADNQLIMMMEFVEGYTLEQTAGQRTLNVNEVAGYISQALSALAYAHERGVVHRDIKPANLMVTSHGIVKLMDFGIAKSNTESLAHTRPGTTMGSLYYMSPEQVRGSGVDPRSDLYSVGIVLYELLAGRRPFEADTTFSILNQQLNVLPQPPIEVNPSVPPRMNEIILKALAKDPAQRFQNAEEFRAALRPFVNAPNGQEVVPPVNAYAEQPQAVGQPVPPAPAQQPYQLPPAYANQGWQNQTPVPAARSGNKGLWIATGAIAAVLALVAAGFAVPHMLKKNGASAATAPVLNTPPDATVSTTPVKVATTPAPGTEPLPTSTMNTTTAPNISTGTQPKAERAIEQNGRPNSFERHENFGGGGNFGHVDNYPRGGNDGRGPNGPRWNEHGQAPNNGYGNGNVRANVPNPAPVNNAELEQAEERMTQMRARANSARRAVGQIRSQQEAMGLGMRGDVESAESRLDSYMQSAGNDLRNGNAAGALRSLDKAETELTTLEKFLGH